MSLIKVVGISLIECVFSIHGVDEHGKYKLRKTINGNNLLSEVVKLPPYLIGMEACSSVYCWVRAFTKLEHTARIMASKFVTYYHQVKIMVLTTLK